MIEAKDFRTFNNIYIYLFSKNELLGADIKLNRQKALIRRMTYVCAPREIGADNHLLKMQRLQNRVFGTIGNFPVHREHVHSHDLVLLLLVACTILLCNCIHMEG
jgi:hypothetical protein